jgi:hypothetical protein
MVYDDNSPTNLAARKTMPLLVPCSSWKVGDKNVITGGTLYNSRTRRDIFATAVTATIPLLATYLLPNGALAFDNRISTAYDNRPKRKGPQDFEGSINFAE